MHVSLTLLYVNYQGDIERSQGLRVSPLCDRNIEKSIIPQGQIGK